MGYQHSWGGSNRCTPLPDDSLGLSWTPLNRSPRALVSQVPSPGGELPHAPHPVARLALFPLAAALAAGCYPTYYYGPPPPPYSGYPGNIYVSWTFAGASCAQTPGSGASPGERSQ